MILVLSGEGPTDLGACSNGQGQCTDKDFAVGPITVLIDQILTIPLRFSLRDYPDRIYYIDETSLCQRAKTLPNRLKPTRSKKQGVETGYFHANAAALGAIAKELEETTHDQAIAALFRDCDSTRSAKSGLWDAKHTSMANGFNYAQFERGVPILPKPTSEAWLLCAAQNQPYQNCQQLEELPGNQTSQNHPKKKLAAAFGRQKSRAELCEWLDDNPFDPERATAMPSFKAFHDRLIEVAEAIRH